MKDIVKSLHPFERKVLPILKDGMYLDEIAEASGLKKVEVMRALQWLSNRKALATEKDIREVINLDKNGKRYLEIGLPERRFLRSIKGKTPVDKLDVSKDELNVCLGLLKQKSAIEIHKEKTLSVAITSLGEELLKKESLEERFLKKLPLELDKLQPEERHAFESLKRRKGLVKLDIEKVLHVRLTGLGKKLSKAKMDVNTIETLSPIVLQKGLWKDREFRTYDIKINTPKVYGGRVHPLQLVINKIRAIFLEMGFKEMEGPWVETSFWCMDSMWIPQDHPSRELQDTFYLPYKGTVPEKIAKLVKAAHEHGGKTGSKGHGGVWDKEVAKQLLLRTHTTATTFRYFGEKDIRPPAKYFYIGRIFRNETTDATHLPEFHQVEGFIMDENLTLKDLMGYVKEFYAKLGIKKIKFKPTYNPYTEPSMECLGYNEELGQWIELINSGVFRPEALEPFGIKTPVIAWGLGVERLAMMLLKQKDIRNLLGATADLKWLREYRLPKVQDGSA